MPMYLVNGKVDHLTPIGNLYMLLECGPPTGSRRPRISGRRPYRGEERTRMGTSVVEVAVRQVLTR